MNAARIVNINTNKILMRTYKEFITIAEKFKPFPEDKVNRQINRKRKSGSNQDAHKMKVAKNFMTKSSNNNHGERAVSIIAKNKTAMIHKGGSGEGGNKDNINTVHKIVDRHISKSNLKDLDQQSDFNRKNKENKKNLNNIYKKDETT
jgi:hypothetical protein